MEREQETIFDTVTGLQASVFDVHQLKDMCRDQQAITMKRMGSWVRKQSKIYQLAGHTFMATELNNMADEIDSLAEVAVSAIFG